MNGESADRREDVLETLVRLCHDLAFAREADADGLFALTGGGVPPDLARLAEAFGMMLVKVESRDYANKLLIEQLQMDKSELEADRRSLAEKNARLLHGAEQRARNIIGNCAPMRQVLDLAFSIARRPINTLITGPTGSGKEVIARLIHFSSARKQGPFIGINCTAIPDSLFESELFGIEKGVATGVDKRKGLVEEADGGTLFLDEIGDMSLPNQAKLLRVLEERSVLRVGSSKPVKVDITLIAATNAHLQEAVQAKKFREDLYYRINVAEIRLPPLKERGDDILLLARHYVQEHCARMGRSGLTLSPAVRSALLIYSWPGNVRELNNEMERVAALAEGPRVEPGDLSPRVRAGVSGLDNAIPELAQPWRARPAFPPGQGPAREADRADPARAGGFNLQEAEHALIRQALERTGGNRRKAADLLGITREGLRKKLLRMEKKDIPDNGAEES